MVPGTFSLLLTGTICVSFLGATCQDWIEALICQADFQALIMRDGNSVYPFLGLGSSSITAYTIILLLVVSLCPGIYPLKAVYIK
jgi:hypothetical protein